MEMIELLDEIDENLSNASTVLIENYGEKNFYYGTGKIPDSQFQNWQPDPSVDFDPSFLTQFYEEKIVDNPSESFVANQNYAQAFDAGKHFEITSIESLHEQLDRWFEDQEKLNSSNETANLSEENTNVASGENNSTASTVGDSPHESPVSKTKALDQTAAEKKPLIAVNSFEDYPLLVPLYKISVSDIRDSSVSYRCEKCNRSFNSKNHLKNHKSYCLKGKHTYECSRCDCVFTNPETLKKHLNIHSLENFYKCTKCPYISNRKDCLKSHISRIHTENRPFFECDTCGKKYRCKLKLKNHVSTCYAKKINPYIRKGLIKCNLCRFKTSSRGLLAKHQLIHEKSQFYVCEDCGKSHPSRAEMKKHFDLADDSRRCKALVYNCDICKFHCRKLDDFIIHIVNAHGCKYLLI